MEWNGTHQLLVYVDDVNMLSEITNAIKRNKKASRQVGLEADTEKTK
jgi:hypothetical protein